ncbi:MAG TPA: ATP-binding protein [Methylomirabilota bacterium]|jgi:signal transduction histidine kinase|nr:ATP-binding protein [Methylomirabilota bacterium]
MLRVGLRWKILLLTALPLLALAAATLWFVDRGVSARSQEDLTGDLRRAADLFENMLSASAAELSVTGAVIVRDPRFFSVLALPHGRHDREFLATVAGVAQDFQQLAHPDVFEIVDSRGDVMASVGRMTMVAIGRDTLVTSALAGRAEKRAVSQRGAQVLLVGTPVVADNRVVGALLLGREVSGALAAQLRELTRSEVTFLSDERITRTTLEDPEDREVARRAATQPAVSGSDPLQASGWVSLVRPLPMAANPARQVYVLQRSLEAETAFLRSVRGHLVELGLLLLAAVAAASLFIAGHITHPIRQLVVAASAMERGEWEVPIDRGREDEMGYLARRFDDMRRRQRTYVRSLQEVARAKSEFIAVASHELRTPISIIRGWEDLLRGEFVKSGTQAFADGLDAIGRACQSLEKIAVSATRMAQSDGSEGPPAPALCGVEPLLADALREATTVAPDRQVTLQVEVEPDARHAILDRNQVLHALDALVRNGIRFTPDGGSVTVRASASGQDFSIEVRDTGIGLSDEARARLLDDTYVPHDSRHHHTATGLEFNVAGMGFGLALVRRVVEAHGGRLLVDGHEGRGSTFTMVFPGARATGEERGQVAA